MTKKWTSKTSSSKMRQTPAVITLTCMIRRPWLAPLVQKPQCILLHPSHIQPPSASPSPSPAPLLALAHARRCQCFSGLLTDSTDFSSRSRGFWCRCSQVCYKELASPTSASVSVFDQPVNMVLCAVLAGGHLEDVCYAQQGLQCVPVSHHL